MARKGVTRLDLIKADIEGWEMQMLKGAENTLKQFRPALMLEMVDHHLARAGDSRDALWTFLTERGYRPHRVAAGRPPIAASADGDVLWIAA